MEIIGNAGNQIFLVKIKEDEIANVAGKNWASDLDNQQRKIGGIIHVGRIYQDARDTLSSYKDLLNKFLSIKKQLTNLTNLMQGKQIPKDDD